MMTSPLGSHNMLAKVPYLVSNLCLGDFLGAKIHTKVLSFRSLNWLKCDKLASSSITNWFGALLLGAKTC